MARGVKILGLD